VQRAGGRGPLVGALVLGSAITASYALPLGFWWLLTARLLWGACWSVLRVEGYISALAVSNAGSRGRVFGVYQAVTRLGQGGGALVGGLLSDLIGIPRVFTLFAALSLTGLLLVFRLPRQRSLGARESKRLRRPVFASGGLAGLLRGRPVPLWAAAVTVTMTEQMAANLTGRLAADRIGPALQGSLGVASLAGALLSLRSLSSFALGPLAGWLGDRVGRRGLLQGLILTQFLTFAALAILRPWRLLLAGLVVQLVCGTAAGLMVYTIAGDEAPAGAAALHLSRFSTFVDLGTALGPAAAFALYARFGFWSVALLAWLLLAAASLSVRLLARGGARE
jgi:MFS family permease